MVGGGVGGAAGVFVIFALLNPFFVNVILVNLGVFGELNRKKIIWIILSYFGVLLLEVLPIYLYREKYVEFFAALFLTTFLWLFPLSFFTWGRKRNIKRKVYVVVAAITVVVVFLYTKPKAYENNKNLTMPPNNWEGSSKKLFKNSRYIFG
ncbi:hypothetical protein [Pedobacter nanyangensis]|uniref:hypothetical protein n=1 Tax=Pedobacter nanyangensis TaxID=1562389 RepID=UPI000DE24DEC|nr:hypothetical protein [Pedobacter nanyangensis]